MMLLAVSCTSEKKVKDYGAKVTDSISGQEFNDIEASSVFEITLHKSDSCYVRLEIAEKLKDKVKAEVTDGKLLLDIEDIKEDESFFDNKKAEVSVYMPSFDNIKLKRACSLSLADTFKVAEAAIEMDEASSFKGNIIAGRLNVEISDASSFKASLYADTLNMNVARACEVDLSSIDDRTGKMFNAEVSKASEFDASKLPFEYICIIGSAASNISVNPVKNIKADIKSASVLEYNAGSKNLVKDIKTSGMSQVEEI